MFELLKLKFAPSKRELLKAIDCRSKISVKTPKSSVVTWDDKAEQG
jgi:hypothetical protein